MMCALDVMDFALLFSNTKWSIKPQRNVVDGQIAVVPNGKQGNFCSAQKLPACFPFKLKLQTV